MSNKPIKLWQYLVPIVVLLAIWFYPVPEGLKPQAWHMFAIFVATIVGILCAPLPSGALMFIALALSRRLQGLGNIGDPIAQTGLAR